MENRINIAELLKDCPKGMELDCTIWDNIVFDHIDMKSSYPIYIKKLGGEKEYLTENGCFSFDVGAKCVIFPKGKTTWEGFQRPFKDGDKLNNHVENLEWCTCSYNVKHGYEIGASTPPWKGKKRDELTIEKLRTCHIGRKQGKDWVEKRIAPRRGVNHPLATKVAQYDLQGNFIKEYNLVKEAAEANGLKLNNVSACLRGKSKTSGGYIWKYATMK